MSQAEYIQDAQLAAQSGVFHGFITRNGGVSTGIYATLNAGRGSNDTPEAVSENRRRIAEAVNTSPQQLLSLYQVHSDRVIDVTTPFADDEKPQADGMVTTTRGLALGILTADCAPVLFADAQAQVIGACHAGWKGAVANIMEHTLQAMEKHGAERKHIIAAIGPCIAQASYEVDAAFRERFLAQSAKNSRFFIRSAKREGHYHFDLPAYVLTQLQISGIENANVLAKDTCFAENAFFSNRRRNLRNEADYGRQISVIMLEP
ncbi:MAG: peptidoglycan editing factor PgeF [Alphaproteobacteria bacterium]|nr:peptidoglycan editing factor PgeF [Alphaproteobacteria bacterium]